MVPKRHAYNIYYNYDIHMMVCLGIIGILLKPFNFYQNSFFFWLTFKAYPSWSIQFIIDVPYNVYLRRFICTIFYMYTYMINRKLKTYDRYHQYLKPLLLYLKSFIWDEIKSLQADPRFSIYLNKSKNSREWLFLQMFSFSRNHV